MAIEDQNRNEMQGTGEMPLSRAYVCIYFTKRHHFVLDFFSEEV